MTMGEKILNMRKARGWNQEELADRVGVTRQAVSRWESNSAKPDTDKLLSVSLLFQVSADYLLRDEWESDTSGQNITSVSSGLTNKGRQQIWLCAAVLILVSVVALLLHYRAPRDVQEVLEQKDFIIQGQTDWDIPVVLDLSALPEGVFKGVTMEFKPREHIIYEAENSTLSLYKVWACGDEYLAFMFCFTHDLPAEGSAITMVHANIGEGTYSNGVYLKDNVLYSDNEKFEDALYYAGEDAYGFTVCIRRDVLAQAGNMVEFQVNGFNRLVYKCDR